MCKRTPIPLASPALGSAEEGYVLEALRSGWVSSAGPFIGRFEEAFAKYCGVKHAITVSNGTVALHLTLHALGIGPGDEVVIPDLTFAATAHAVLQTGASPVLVDVDPVTWCMDLRAFERAITHKTRAVIPVHLYGHPAPMHEICEIALARKISVIEDAAEAHGATIGRERMGSFGDVGAFSFYGNKLMTTGEGGMVVTSNEPLAKRMRFLKDHGMSKERRYYHNELAFNYRMTNLQAALGLAQLEKLEGAIQARRQVFSWYKRRLEGKGVFAMNAELAGVGNVYWMTSVILPDADPRGRDEVCRRMLEMGVETRPFFVAMSELPHLAKCRRQGPEGNDCPVARRLSASGINLPSGYGLGEDDVEMVVRALLHAAGVRS